jgi:hypothetical protein
MEEYRELMEKIAAKGEKFEDMIEFRAAMDEIMSRVCKNYPQMFHDFVEHIEDIVYEMPLEKAQYITRGMKPFGEHWTYEDVKNVLSNKGIYKHCIEYYLVMNMVYNDYYDVATNFGHQSDVEFYFELANAFINDLDGKKHKVVKYFMD